MNIPALDKVIDIFRTQDAFAAAMGLRSASVSGWRRRGKIPADRCLAIEQATEGKVTRYDLRPDVFGEAPASELEEAS